MLERTKEVMRLKLRVRRLEAKCLRVLGGSAVPCPGADAGVGDEPAAGEKKAADGDERQGNGEDCPPTEAAPTAATRVLGEGPLVILRNDRSSKEPSILRQLRANQLSDSMTNFMPSDIHEAKEANHRLKIQLLNLEAVLLKWVMKNKIRDDALKKKAEDNDENTVRGPRLRELLRLEAAVKAMFTEAQIRAIIRNHDASCGDATEKLRKHPWGDEDLRRMLELRAISSDKVLDHVREKMKIPLPTLSTARLRCEKSPMLTEAYKKMLQKREQNQKLCSMCKCQMNTIDGVVDAKDDKPAEVEGESPFGRQFVQRVSKHDQDTAGARPKKRRRTPAAAKSAAKKRRSTAAVLDWPDTSDSDAELSDPGMLGRVLASRVKWHPEVIGGSAPPDRPPPPPRRMESDSFGYGQAQRPWR